LLAAGSIAVNQWNRDNTTAAKLPTTIANETSVEPTPQQAESTASQNKLNLKNNSSVFAHSNNATDSDVAVPETLATEQQQPSSTNQSKAPSAPVAATTLQLDQPIVDGQAERSNNRIAPKEPKANRKTRKRAIADATKDVAVATKDIAIATEHTDEIFQSKPASTSKQIMELSKEDESTQVVETVTATNNKLIDRFIDQQLITQVDPLKDSLLGSPLSLAYLPITLQTPIQPLAISHSNTSSPNKIRQNNKIKFAASAEIGFSNASSNFFNVLAEEQKNFDRGGIVFQGSVTQRVDPVFVPSIYWRAGLDIYKKINNRWTLTAGVGLQQFSYANRVSSRIDTTISILNNNNLSTQTYTRFYNPGKTSTINNSLLFLNVPITAAYCLNPRQKNAIDLTIGVSGSFLLNSDAWTYLSAQNIFVKDAEEINTFRMGLILGADFHFFNNRFSIGPTIQYGLSSMLNLPSGNDLSLSSLALKMRYRF
jgi:hypothetical protein